MSLASATSAGAPRLDSLSPEVREALEPRWSGFVNKAGIALVIAGIMALAFIGFTGLFSGR